jgi:hypothetical protein
MASEHTEAQASTAAKLTPPHTAADKLRFQLADLGSCPTPPNLYLLFYVHAPTSAQTSLSGSGVTTADVL